MGQLDLRGIRLPAEGILNRRLAGRKVRFMLSYHFGVLCIVLSTAKLDVKCQSDATQETDA